PASFQHDRERFLRFTEEPAMKLIVTLSTTALCIAGFAATRPANHTPASSGRAPALQSVGTLAFGPPGILYAADPQGATIFAIKLPSAKTTPGTRAVDGIDKQVAAVLGTVPDEITITDLAVEPRSGNSYLAVMRGKGTDARAVLLRVDGAGKVDV